jgi:uncharacterized protein YnzC (UPF0291/DUF896 family)
MNTDALTENSEAAILNRVIDPEAPTLTPDAARSILALGFRQADIDRMNQLAEKNRQGKLTAEEDAALNNYLHVGRFIGLVQAKARKSLQQHTGIAS